MKAFWAAENWLRLRVLSIALIVLLPAAAVAFMNVDSTARESVDLVGRENLSTARLLAEQQATLVDATEQILRLLATSDAVIRGDPEACDAEMRRVTAAIPHYANIGMADAQGIVRCSAAPLPETPVSIAETDFFQAAMTHDDFARGSYRVGPIAGVPGVHFAYPVRYAGVPGGVVYAALDLGAFHALARDARPEPGTVYVFLDGFGRVLSASEDAELTPGERMDADFVAALVAERQGVARHELAGRASLVSFTELADSGPGNAYVVVATPVALVESQAQAAFWASGLGLGVAAAAGIVAAFFLAEQIIVREQRERLRERSVRIERLQEADRQHVMMVNEIGHDLRSPLTPIKLQLYLLRKNGDGLHPRHEKALDVVARNVEHMERLIADLRDVFRADAAQFVLEPQAVDLSRQLDEARETFEEIAQRKKIALRFDIAPDLRVRADPDRLNQAVFNLLSNAIKFTHEAGLVTVRAEREGSAVRIAVTDDGPGLTPQEIDRLFRPFSQVGRAAGDTGTGLGLYISKSIIEAHGGETGVTSPGPGRGATFWFTLPVEGPRADVVWDTVGMARVETH